MSINYSELSITVITNVLFISLFIGLFFFTYAAHIEEQIVKKQMEFLSETISSSVKVLGPDVSRIFKNYVNNLPELDLNEADKTVEKMNTKTKKNALFANIIFAIFVGVCVYFIFKNSDKSFSVKDILIKNAIILVFVALTEFVFLTYFGANYISLNPNVIVYNIIKKIKELITV